MRQRQYSQRVENLVCHDSNFVNEATRSTRVVGESPRPLDRSAVIFDIWRQAYKTAKRR
jgi:hypothetical protein